MRPVFLLLAVFANFINVNMADDGVGTSDCFCGSSSVKQESIGSADFGKKEKKNGPEFRIVGGRIRNDLSWMAYVGIRTKKYQKRKKRIGNLGTCGGAVVSERFVLTAAHCVKNKRFSIESPRQIFVILGSPDITNRRRYFFSAVQSFHEHPDYDVDSLANDIALLKMRRTVDFGRFPQIRTICVTAPDSYDVVETNTKAMVAGWGSIKDKNCKTTEQGPAMYQICRFPFKERKKRKIHPSIHYHSSFIQISAGHRFPSFTVIAKNAFGWMDEWIVPKFNPSNNQLI